MENRENKVLWLSQEDTVACGVTDMGFIFENVKKCNIMLTKGETYEAPSAMMLWDETFFEGQRCGIHGAIIRSKDEKQFIAGVKSIPSNPENPKKFNKPRANALMMLYDYETGYPLCVMDETLISAMRTGAGAGLGATYLARKGAETVGLIGCGPIGGYSVEATLYGIKTIKTVKLFDYNKEAAEKLAKKLAYTGVKFEFVDSAEAAVRDSDVVLSVTNTKQGNGYVEADWVKRGAFLCEVSMWDFKEECYLLPNCKFALDWTERIKNSANGNMRHMMREGRLDKTLAVQLGDVILGNCDCRTSDDDIVYYNTTGLCITDVYNSYKIYERALEQIVGSWVYQWHNPIQ